MESKFSEYYAGVGKKLKIAAAYLTNKYSGSIYGSDCLAEMGLDIEEQPGASQFSLVSKDDEDVYLHGIKQMISHYVGVRNFCDNQAAKNRIISASSEPSSFRKTQPSVGLDIWRVQRGSTTSLLAEGLLTAEAFADEVSGEVKILLGEILFTKGIGKLPIGSGKSCLASYQEKYRILAKELNRQIDYDGMSNHFTVLSDILSYSQFQKSSCIKEERVKRFYFGSGKN